MNNYEQMFFDDKEGLRNLICTLVEAAGGRNTDEITSIRKCIDFDVKYVVEAEFSGESFVRGTAYFDSFETLREACREAGGGEQCPIGFEGGGHRFNIEWDGHPDNGLVQLIDDEYRACIYIHGIADDASEDALHADRLQDMQTRLKQKQQALQGLQADIVNLEVEINQLNQ